MYKVKKKKKQPTKPNKPQRLVDKGNWCAAGAVVGNVQLY